ncbi:hypothetical protein CTAYLR_007973 [Chrysophaeum taylorii]|uniref:Uncharacterized protein n=1 Tax=Chrysophaeum taylorii TaxID=2483200 RepID=A0AAD7UA55_9STRA|nr:hypothetical protein CTAYLR_007973 [Chrysophaeum taylorii]
MNLCARAQRALKRFAVENSDCNQVEALELLDAAAREFAVGGQPEKAAKCYRRCADASLRTRSPFAAAAYCGLAAELKEGHDPLAAIEAYDRAAELCCDIERWDAAGIYALKAASLGKFEDDVCDPKRFVDAADLFAAAAESDDRRSVNKNGAMETVADLAAADSEYESAADIYEGLARDEALDNLTAPNAVRLFFRAALCRIVALFDLDLVKRQCGEDFGRAYLPWLDSADRAFLDDLVACLRHDLPDLDFFADAAYDFAAVRKLDPVDLDLLSKVYDRVAKAHEAHNLKLEKAKRKAQREKHKFQIEKDRQARLVRDNTPAARGD